MKYKYTGTVPTVCVVDGILTQVNRGDVVNLLAPISPEFVIESGIKKDIPVRRVTPQNKKVLKDGTRTETSSLGK